MLISRWLRGGEGEMGKDACLYAPKLQLFAVLSPFCANSSYSLVTPCYQFLM